MSNYGKCYKEKVRIQLFEGYSASCLLLMWFPQDSHLHFRPLPVTSPWSPHRYGNPTGLPQRMSEKQKAPYCLQWLTLKEPEAGVATTHSSDTEFRRWPRGGAVNRQLLQQISPKMRMFLQPSSPGASPPLTLQSSHLAPCGPLQLPHHQHRDQHRQGEECPPPP